ncbi:hypothetical protein NPIL_449251 [Nephila pilipes]|uniref:Uncharacterized protein n=1 Tax=Nephila pilipes TaxID=299642 RepID=A0A8X6N333_NEPPI|nr:hypothetical protein NPIL_449251 [Nephila pilipes]
MKIYPLSSEWLLTRNWRKIWSFLSRGGWEETLSRNISPGHVSRSILSTCPLLHASLFLEANRYGRGGNKKKIDEEFISKTLTPFSGITFVPNMGHKKVRSKLPRGHAQ